MSNDAWAIQQLKKYELTVNFYFCKIIAPDGYSVTFGTGKEYATFYGALTYMTGRIRNA